MKPARLRNLPKVTQLVVNRGGSLTLICELSFPIQPRLSYGMEFIFWTSRMWEKTVPHGFEPGWLTPTNAWSWPSDSSEFEMCDIWLIIIQSIRVSFIPFLLFPSFFHFFLMTHLHGEKNENRVTTGWKTHFLKKNNFFLSVPELTLQNGTKAKGHICHHIGNITTPDCHPSNSKKTRSWMPHNY